MSITAGSLYRDTGNFLRHQLVTIVLMSLLTSFITVLIGHALTPGADQLSMLTDGSRGSGMSLLEMVQNMSPDQQRILLRASAAGTFASLVGNTLLLGGMLSLIPMVSAGQRVSALRAIGTSAPSLPRLLLLVFIMTLVVQLGFMVLVVPGVLLAVVLALAPIVLSTEKVGIFASMRLSVRLVWGHLKLVAPAVALWLLAKIVVLLLASSLTVLPANVASVVLNALSNLISAIMIIYLYRLYMLLR
ncbi:MULTISPECIES: YciC family protein [unclassified Erwinia]|uniref:YciC family protein n=1 Tax=unclassified Erwinia TaxID=2622719 RepID=UPI00082D85E3|nr:YciC family protein [Erwinia sp. ErVv1]